MRIRQGGYIGEIAKVEFPGHGFCWKITRGEGGELVQEGVADIVRDAVDDCDHAIEQLASHKIHLVEGARVRH